MHINLEHAEKAIEAARKKAIGLKTQMCIAVVDSGANLKAFLRMDDAWVGSIDIAIKKAKTACFFGMATGQLGKLSQPSTRSASRRKDMAALSSRRSCSTRPWRSPATRARSAFRAST